MTDGVVAEIAGEPAAKARQPGARRGAVAAQELADERQRVAFVTLDDTAPILDFDLPSARADPDLRRQADERVAPEALAADYRLQQIGIALVGELEIKRKRRVEVGKGLKHEGNAVIPLRCKSAELGFGHDAPTILCSNATLLQASLFARDA